MVEDWRMRGLEDWRIGGLEDWRIGVVIKLDIVNKQPGSRNAKALQTTNIFGDWVKWRNLGEMRKGALIRE
jgi:hypothetical protein